MKQAESTTPLCSTQHVGRGTSDCRNRTKAPEAGMTGEGAEVHNSLRKEMAF